MECLLSVPLNPYFKNGTSGEQGLYEDLIIESIRAHGEDVYYIPRTVVEMDMVLNEDTLSKFSGAHLIEMYLESIDGYEGDGKFISKFGLEIRDQVILVVAKRRWNQLVGPKLSDGTLMRPKEGDLIFFPLAKGLFEIKYCDAEKPFHQLRGLPVYKLTCELFEYRNEEIDTGIGSVDSIMSTSMESYRVVVEIGPDEEFSFPENVTITLPTSITGSAKVLSSEASETVVGEVILSLGPLTFDDNRFHKLVVGTTITGDTSGATAEVMRLLELGEDLDEDLFENDTVAQNSTFEETGNDVIDFSESNPFGEPDDL